MLFPARELKDYCDYVKAKDLVVGRIYFTVHFLDAECLLPELTPRIFVGRNLFPNDEGGKSYLYYREVDLSSPPPPYTAVAPVETGKPDEESAEAPSLECEEESEYSGVVEFEEALDQLLECSLRRQAQLSK